MSLIHPTAIISEGAEIGDGTSIGPYTVIGPHVKIGKNNSIHAHVVLDGRTSMGDGNRVYSFSCLGKNSQDLKYRDDMVTYTQIGDNNTFREYTTVHAASIEGESTVIGNDCHILAYSHIAHDCILGNNIIISSNVMIAGHVLIDDNAIINGMSGAQQFCHIGRFAFIGGTNKVIKDILPFCIADGNPSVPRAINKIGMERNGFSSDQIKIVRDAYKIIIRSGKPLEEAAALLQEKYPDNPEVNEMIDFAVTSKTGIARPAKK